MTNTITTPATDQTLRQERIDELSQATFAGAYGGRIAGRAQDMTRRLRSYGLDHDTYLAHSAALLPYVVAKAQLDYAMDPMARLTKDYRTLNLPVIKESVRVTHDHLKVYQSEVRLDLETMQPLSDDQARAMRASLPAYTGDYKAAIVDDALDLARGKTATTQFNDAFSDIVDSYEREGVLEVEAQRLRRFQAERAARPPAKLVKRGGNGQQQRVR